MYIYKQKRHLVAKTQRKCSKNASMYLKRNHVTEAQKDNVSKAQTCSQIANL